MRNVFVVLWMLLCSITAAAAQVSVGIALPGVSIGINLPVYPQLVRVPGYPVYYAPQVNSNYFFYDGMYWAYQRDNWYASTWYNGPWMLVTPEAVPLFVLRVPVRYYRQRPAYFGGWRADAPPHWGEHWGNAWEQRQPGWNNWDRSAVPLPAPLPVYQRQYSGSRYPRVEQQQELQSRNYGYQPHEPVVQQHYQAQRARAAPAASPQAASGVPQQRTAAPQDKRAAGRPPSPQQGLPAGAQEQPQPPATQREQHASSSRGQDKGPQGQGSGQEPKQDRGKRSAPESKQGPDKGHEKGDPREGERGK